LIEAGVTHILNASCREYTKRSKYFKYLDVQIYDAHTENAKNHFRITNRFIEEGRREGKVLVHSVQGKSRAPTFILHTLRQFVQEVEPNEVFMSQLAEYDLEILSKY
jgi:protein-tyrosine phosphatase